MFNNLSKRTGTRPLKGSIAIQTDSLPVKLDSFQVKFTMGLYQVALFPDDDFQQDDFRKVPE